MVYRKRLKRQLNCLKMTNELILQVGVKALIKNKEGKFLLVYRADKKYSQDVIDKKVAGHWDIVGGRINVGENLIDNLKREIKEETNLDLTGEPKLLSAQDIFRKVGHHVIRLTYLAEAEGEIKLDQEENTDYQWLTWEELNNLEDIDTFFQELLDKKIIENSL